MTGLVCLQGGAEFTVGCAGMDGDLARVAPGRVVVTALAGTVGRDYATATANGVRHYLSVGAADVVGAPDVREDPQGALAVLRTARLVVLPGGSPSRLLAALQDTGAADVLAALLADGVTVVGSSAGAMVLGSWTVLPDRGGRDGVQVAPGLGLVPGVLVVPHWSGDAARGDWLQAIDAQVPGDVTVLGIPEQSGVLVSHGTPGPTVTLTAVGRSVTTLVRQRRDLSMNQGWRMT